MENSIKTTSYFWLLYFLLSIAVIGFLLGYLLTVPFLALGRWFPRAQRIGDLNLVRGIRVLMDSQPWLTAQITLPGLPSLQSRREHKPQGCLLISNHRSHLDAFILLSRVQGIRILAKRSLFWIPLLGSMMRLTRQIPTRRGDIASFVNSMNVVKQRLEQGETVHVFPEMTRCPPGFRGTQEFMTAPFHSAIQSGAVVIPIVFKGTDQVWPKGKAALSFRTPIQVQALTPIQAKLFTSATALRDETRRVIEQALA